MTTYILTPSATTQTSALLTTDKIRIATTACAIAINVGTSGVTANLTGCQIIPANTVERSFIVGQGKYIAFMTANGTAAPFSITELGAPHTTNTNGAW